MENPNCSNECTSQNSQQSYFEVPAPRWDDDGFGSLETFQSVPGICTTMQSIEVTQDGQQDIIMSTVYGVEEMHDLSYNQYGMQLFTEPLSPTQHQTSDLLNVANTVCSTMDQYPVQFMSNPQEVMMTAVDPILSNAYGQTTTQTTTNYTNLGLPVITINQADLTSNEEISSDYFSDTISENSIQVSDDEFPSDDSDLPPSPMHPSLLQTGNQRRKRRQPILSEFLYSALENPDEYSNKIRWVDRSKGTFEFISEKKEELSEEWGTKKKNHKKMTYQKLSRALRLYIRKDRVLYKEK
uniref:ETS domain-containing protein n=1 Tax=Ciona savignyi TaxID=51511 RepID=H2YJR5_CIOSA